jgi:hypothetical protein
MLNTFVMIHLEPVACAESAHTLAAVCHLHKGFNMITTTTNAAT